MSIDPSRHIKTVLFDLDGTLADTAPDLAFALNTLLAEEGREALAYDLIRPVASHGGIALIQLGFKMLPEDPGFEPLRQRFLALYAQNLARETRLFDGMTECLRDLKARNINWGIVTNKPAFLTDPLVAALGLQRETACVVSGDSTANRKPHPEPMLKACALAGSAPEECLYVGDAERDIAAGRQAGMSTLIALYGYIGETDKPAQWQANGTINHPSDILSWLENHG